MGDHTPGSRMAIRRFSLSRKNPDLQKQLHQAFRLPAAKPDTGKHGAVPAPAYGEATWATECFINY